MKRFACVLLAAAMLALYGCGGPAAPVDSPSAAPEGPGLARHELVSAAVRLLLADDALVQVLVDSNEYAGRRVETTPGLLRGVANALYYGAEDAGENARYSADGDGVTPEIIDENEATIFLITPDSGLSGYIRAGGGRCAVYLALEGESALLDYPASVYDAILALAVENMVPATLEVAGELIPLQTPGMTGVNVTTQWMDCAGGLAALYTGGNGGQRTSALEIFDPETGESLYYSEIGAEALRMEAASFSACDMRVVMADGAMWYLNSQNPEVKPYYFYLPAELRSRLLAPYHTDRPTLRAFDGGTGQGALWALVDDAGITWQRRSSGGTIPNDVILENLPDTYPVSEEYPPAFGEVRLMNGGGTLVATVVLPTSQIGAVGLFTYQLSSGAINWYFGMFNLPMASLHYASDTRLLVAGEEEIYHLNVATGEEHTTPSPENIITAQTADFEHFVFTGHTMNPGGTWTITLYTETPDDPFVSVTGSVPPPIYMSAYYVARPASMQARGVSERHVILTLSDAGKESWHLAPLP